MLWGQPDCGVCGLFHRRPGDSWRRHDRRHRQQAGSSRRSWCNPGTGSESLVLKRTDNPDVSLWVSTERRAGSTASKRREAVDMERQQTAPKTRNIIEGHLTLLVGAVGRILPGA